jgi:aquaporin Z
MNDNARSALAEFIGTFILIFIGCGSVVMAGNLLPVGGGGGLVAVALAHGLALACIVSAIGHVSGGHVNPAVTAGLWVTGQIETAKAALYLGSQLLGALAGALALKLVMPSALTNAVHLGTPGLDSTMGTGAAVVLEAILTFFLVFIVYGNAVDSRGASSKIAGLGIGLVLTFDILAGGPMTGAAMNPARWFGPAVASGTWTDWWVWIVGPLAGGIIAGFVGKTVFSEASSAKS